MGSQKTILIASPCCRFRSKLGHVDALKPGRISRITFEVCIIQSDDEISITIVKKTNQQLAVTKQFNSTSVFLESCVRQSAIRPAILNLWAAPLPEI